MRSPRVLLTSLVWLVLAVLAACGDNISRVPTKISLDPESPRLPAGIQLDVTAHYVSTDLTATAATDVTWSVADTTVATVTPGAGGHATLLGVKAGTTALMVAGQGISSTFTVTVTPAQLKSLAITPPQPSIAAGTSIQLTATGTFSDMTTMDLSATVAWSSSATATATVDSTGLLRGVAAGQATINATLGTVSAMASATVTSAVLTSIQVTPTDPSLPVGVTQQFTATGMFSDSSTQDLTAQVTWSSDADTQATVSATGLVTAVAVGAATITATQGSVSGSSHVTVTAAALKSIAIDPPAPKVALGLTLQLTATGTFTDGNTQDLTAQVTWASATETVATVSATGLVTSVLAGTTQITATKGSITGTTTFEVTPAIVQSIQVTPVTPTIAVGTAKQFTATGTFSDLTTHDITTQVTWTSSDTNVATISNADPTRGLATSVTPAVVTLPATTTITATFAQASGNVTGTTTLQVTDATLASIAVTAVATPPVNPMLAKGLTLQFVATGTFTDNSTQDLTKQVTWDSSDLTVATISNAANSQGQATALAEGTTTITATFVQASGNVSGSTNLTVTPAVLLSIAVAPTAPSLPIGHQLSFTALGTFTDGVRDITTQVTWDSSDTGVATISNADGSRGVATGVALGITTITATFVQSPTNVTGTTTLTVTAAVVDSIAIDPLDASLPKGRHQQFKATATLSDHSTEDVTDQVTWVSSDITVAQISSAAGSNGDATGLKQGTTTISATFVQPSGNVTQSTPLTVTDAVLDSLSVMPVTVTLATSSTEQFTAIGTFSDNTTKDLTTQVTWTSGNTVVIQIDPTQGLATTISSGTATITAASGTVTRDASVTVQDNLACASLTDPTNGSVSTTNGGIFPSTATYTCDAGLVPSGPSTRTCAGDGTWSGSAPTCDVPIMVVRVGNGAVATGGTSVPVFVEERSSSSGFVARTINLPTAVTPFTLTNNATSEGGLSRSVDGHFVTLAGYAALPGVPNIASTGNTTATGTNRVVARIDAAGTVDASTLLFNAFSGGNPRAATTIDGTSFWVSGTSSGSTGGVQFVQLGSTGTATHVLSTPDNSRWVNIFNGQLYASSSSGTATTGVLAVGTGTPMTNVMATRLFNQSNAYGFALFDRNAAVTGLDTLYIAIDASPGTDRLNVQKWTFDGTNWTQDANFKPALTGSNVGARGLVAFVDAAVVHIIATTNEGTQNHIVTFVDDGTTETPAVTSVVASPQNTLFRGVALSPVP